MPHAFPARTRAHVYTVIIVVSVYQASVFLVGLPMPLRFLLWLKYPATRSAARRTGKLPTRRSKMWDSKPRIRHFFRETRRAIE